MRSGAASAAGDGSAARRRRALVICAHLRPSRDKRRSRYFMQPISGLQVASLIDPDLFDVELFHEDWHGPYDTRHCAGYDIVFLSGLQVDFDRMRQLSCHFRRAGAKIVAGGSICTVFPEFATEFFDAVCAGGVDSVRDVIADFVRGNLRPIYRSPIKAISSYRVEYRLFAASGIDPMVHLVEATRGCSFKCSFCVMPSEVGGHVTYALSDVAASIEDALAASPRLGFRRNYPLVMFLDNNLSDDRAHLLAIAAMMKAHPKVRGWAALVTQNTLNDRDLIANLAASKCVGLFAGIETFDANMLRRFRKTQNLSRRFNIIDDVAFAESCGISIGYGLLFDPRHQTAAEMQRQLIAIAEDPRLPMPVYMSVVAPLAGTESFWNDLAAGNLAPGLRLRDLDGETICYSGLVDQPDVLARFVERAFRRPWTIVSRPMLLAKTLRRIVRSGSWNPVRWYLIASATLHCYFWSRATPGGGRTYLPRTDPLDPQYGEYPEGMTEDEHRRYFEPVKLTGADGRAVDWLVPYVPGIATEIRAAGEAR